MFDVGFAGLSFLSLMCFFGVFICKFQDIGICLRVVVFDFVDDLVDCHVEIWN